MKPKAAILDEDAGSESALRGGAANDIVARAVPPRPRP